MKRFIFWTITVLFPFLLLFLIEMALRFGGYNEEVQDLFVEVPIQPDHVVVNPAFVSRYFPAFTPKVAKSPFLKNKDENTFRVFVLGGSSTQGFPYNFYSSFSTQLEERLLMETNGLNIEVINLGMTAVNSFVMWDLTKRLIKYDPDAVLIYAGHNEYYGSFGVASTQFGFGDGVALKRLILNLKNFRIYQFFEGILNSKDNNDLNPDNRTLMARVVKESGIELKSNTFEAGIRQFEENLSNIFDILNKSEVPVFIGTVTSNLKDQDPLGENESALSNYSQGNIYFDSGYIDSARTSYLKAKELDPIRFRAPEAINDVIVRTAKSYNAHLIDVNTSSADASLSTIQDESFFTDHLHPDWQGHQLIADLFFNELRSNIKEVKDAFLPNVLYRPSVNSEFEESYAEVQVKRLTVGYPFEKGLSGEQEYGMFQQAYEAYLGRSFVDSVAAHAWRTQREIPLALTDIINYKNGTSDTASVLNHYQQLAYWQVYNNELLKKGVNYAINNRNFDAYSARLLHIILSRERKDPFFANTLAALYLIHQDLNRSEYWLKKVEKLDPKSPLLWYSYARLYALKGDTEKARESFEKYNQLRNSP